MSESKGYTISCLINDIESLSGHKFDVKRWQLVFKDSPLQDWSLTFQKCGIERNDTLFIQPLGFAKNIFNPEVDVCFLVDCTSSMASHIANVKNYVMSFRSHLEEKYIKCDLRFAFVRYTDYDVSERTTFLEFTKDHSTFDGFVGNVRARGGRDTAEDVMGGLKAVFELSWRRRAAKVLIHIADAPCHGKMYHNNCSDSYPSGDKEGLTHEQMMDKVNEHSIDYWFGYIDQGLTDKMISVFNEYLQQISNKTLLIRQFDATQKPFLSFNRCIYTTVTASEVTTKVYDEEKEAFCEWINDKLRGDPEVSEYLPIPKEGDGLYKALSDGVIVCKVINKSVPGTIDERTINKGKLDETSIHENLSLALNSASSLGCNTTNVSQQDIVAGRPFHIQELLWQIFKNGLFSQISIDNNPELSALVTKEEGLHILSVLPKEEILLRWFNYHLEHASFRGRVNNFSSDIMDSKCYTALLVQMSPPGIEIDESHLEEKDLEIRARKMLKQAEKVLDGQKVLQPKDVVTGNTRLNVAFIANLFNKNPALKSVGTSISVDTGESKEEKAIRNWMNSLGVSPHVNNLYSDLTDGLVLLQLFDKMQPGIVDWSKVNKKDIHKAVGGKMKKIENCNYAVSIAKKMQLWLVGIDGYNIHDGNKKGILSLVSQMMNAYTISMLQKLTGSDRPIKDKEIISWVNSTLNGARKTSKIESFKDPAISTAIPVIDLVDAIKPGSIRYEVVKQGDALPEKEKLENAMYAVSMCQKIGASVYILPDDLVEGSVKMCRTMFACLMMRGKATK